MRRRAGVAAVHGHRDTQQLFSDKSSQLQVSQLEELNEQLRVFREHLQRFAAKHRHEIRRDAQFRQQFQEMCAAIGVDPLASSKGFWCQLLGVGDYYYQLAVRVVETCMAASQRTGGLMPLAELQQRLATSYGEEQPPSVDDVQRAVSSLHVLGSGLKLLKLADGSALVQSVPAELSGDQLLLIQAARTHGGCYRPGSTLSAWSRQREDLVLQQMLRDRMVWIDSQTDGDLPDYWFPSLFSQTAE